jgi:GDP-L-fucose synthase
LKARQKPNMETRSKILVAGAHGLVGSAIVSKLFRKGFTDILTPTRNEVDFTDQFMTKEYMKEERPDYVFIAAAMVGGIKANHAYPIGFLLHNLQIQNNLIQFSYHVGVKKLLFLGSSCIYPRDCPQPIKEEYLLTGPLEPTNEPYAIAKIAGIKLCDAFKRQNGQNFFSAMPCNTYGPNDNYHPQDSHVIPGLIRKIHKAKEDGVDYVQLWGTGKALREFIYVDDLADACLFLMENYEEGGHINVGSGQEISIHDLAKLIADTIDYEGELKFGSDVPDGTPRKVLNSSRIRSLGWRWETQLAAGLETTYESFLAGRGRNR